MPRACSSCGRELEFSGSRFELERREAGHASRVGVVLSRRARAIPREARLVSRHLEEWTRHFEEWTTKRPAPPRCASGSWSARARFWTALCDPIRERGELGRWAQRAASTAERLRDRARGSEAKSRAARL